jgi:hypothetical protein
MPPLKWIFLFLIAAISFATTNHISKPTDEMALTLKWNKAYPDDTIDQSAVGLQWSLSFVGALLPNSPTGINVGTQTITLNLGELGFDQQALQRMILLHRKIKASEEYQRANAVDMGRYVTLLIGASQHYYAITGMPQKLDAALSAYALEPEMGYVNNSEVSFVHRNIRFSKPDGLKQFFVATEIDSLTRQVLEYETWELMANGQPRFGIYDAEGNLKNNADPQYTTAGKPAKCMWCHESGVQQMFRPQRDFPGNLMAAQLQEKLIGFNQLLQRNRVGLPGMIDFSKRQQHTLSELLYISFMEPSAQRLSLEWQMPVAEVQQLLSGLPTHVYEEFGFLGQLYDRNVVEKLAPFKGLAVSSSVRESSVLEVNHLFEP